MITGGIPETQMNSKNTRGLHHKTSTNYAYQTKVHPRNGHQQRVGEAIVAKHPPVKSSASIRKRPSNCCEEKGDKVRQQPGSRCEEDRQ
jgi:hypothetical protein